MIPYANVNITNSFGFYKDFELEEDELLFLARMSEEGREQEAIDKFVNEYILPPGTKYSELMSRYMLDAQSGVLLEKDKNRLIRNISVLTIGLSLLLISNFDQYAKKSYSKEVVKRAGLSNSRVEAAILKEALSKFEERISGAMSQTQTFIINGIRSIQRDMIVENFTIQKSGISGDVLDARVEQFKKSLRVKYPQYYRGMEEGKILVSRKFTVDGEELVRHYKLNYYSDMSVRTTLLNIDRNAQETMALVNGEKVIGYELGDPRTIKKEREICIDILGKKVLGKSILAMDSDIAGKLGIMTVDEARSTPDYAMGPYCRHVLRRLSSDYLKKIDERLSA